MRSTKQSSREFIRVLAPEFVHNTQSIFSFSQERFNMNLKTSAICALFALIGFSSNAFAQDPVATVVTGCNVEIETYCSQVSPGEGRLLACFYAHEDKLSGQCQYALYMAAAELEVAINSLDYVAGQCKNDISTLCPNVEAGEGRILECLAAQKESVSAKCTAAIEQVFE
jgi:hypothetical protein